MSISDLRLWARTIGSRTPCAVRCHVRRSLLATSESLEKRHALSTATAAVPAIQMISATTTDSKSVTVEYRVNQTPSAANPIQFGIYRSSNGQFDSSDSLVSTFTLTSQASSPGPSTVTLDQNGQPAATVGTHQLTIPLAQGLPPYPEKPYVLVVADPGAPSATSEPQQSTAFRTYTIGIVTHGGIQDPSWTHGPPWELQTAYLMRHEGFDSVIAYNWALQSSTPGAAIQQSPRLARMILAVANKFPAGAPVNLEFIGHSEGTVINTYAIVALERKMAPQLESGYIQDILLDPHAANNNVPGQQDSFGGVLGGIAKDIVTDYQADADDPPAYIPAAVDSAEVFFQHSQATADAIYNLWGQVPVKSDGPVVHYYNLTDIGATHSGKTGVNYWFANFIAPTLGYQAPLIQELQLNGQIDDTQSPTNPSISQNAIVRRAERKRANRVYGPAQIVQNDQPQFSGTAGAGSIIRLYVSPAAKPMDLALAGITTADSTGQWSLTTRHSLANGQYRILASAFSRALATRPALAIVPTQPLGRLVIDTPA
jgi:hypothetical protein